MCYSTNDIIPIVKFLCYENWPNYNLVTISLSNSSIFWQILLYDLIILLLFPSQKEIIIQWKIFHLWLFSRKLLLKVFFYVNLQIYTNVDKCIRLGSIFGEVLNLVVLFSFFGIHFSFLSNGTQKYQGVKKIFYFVIHKNGILTRISHSCTYVLLCFGA